MKERLLLLTAVMMCCVSGYLYASSVTAIDSQNVIVTDDGGFDTPYKTSTINMIQSTSCNRASKLQQDYQAAHETCIVWSGIRQMTDSAINSINNVISNTNP